MKHDSVKVTTFVAVPVEDAFAVFTEEIDQWWRRGPAYRIAGRSPGTLHLEPKLGGRIFEQVDHAPGAAVHEVGSILVWEPPHHFAFAWRSVTFAPGETTTVDVQFAASANGTRVTLEHRGWASIRADHPVRHGESAPQFMSRMGTWWMHLATSYRHLAEAEPAGGGFGGRRCAKR